MMTEPVQSNYASKLSFLTEIWDVIQNFNDSRYRKKVCNLRLHCNISCLQVKHFHLGCIHEYVFKLINIYNKIK